jgi:hypothetical protein
LEILALKSLDIWPNLKKQNDVAGEWDPDFWVCYHLWSQKVPCGRGRAGPYISTVSYLMHSCESQLWPRTDEEIEGKEIVRD